MPLLKKRPALVLDLSSAAIPGQPLRGNLVVKAKKAVEVDWLKVTFVGTEKASMGAGDSTRSKIIYAGFADIVLVHKGTLDAGTQEFPFQFNLPDYFAPSYSSPHASTRYEIRARASVPWWPDAKIKRGLTMRTLAGAAEHPGRPMLLSTSADGPQPKEPHAEVSFAQSVFCQGETISGAVALSNVANNRYRSVRIELMAAETVRIDGYASENTWVVYQYAIDVNKPTEGQQIPFRLELPAEIPTTTKATLWELKWLLQVRIDLGWASDLRVRVPIPIVDKRFRSTRALPPPPAVGQLRAEAFWGELARRRGLELVGSALRGSFGETTVLVWQEQSRDGRNMHAKLTYPSLGLDLKIKRLRGWSFRRDPDDILIGTVEWHRRHRVTARSELQAAGFLSEISADLSKLTNLEADDGALTTERKRFGASAEQLEQFLEPVLTLASRIESARERIPSPIKIAGWLPRFTEFADSLSGSFNRANFSIQGRFHEHPLTVKLIYRDGEPEGFVVALELVRQLDENLAVSLVFPKDDAISALASLPAGLPQPVVAHLEALATQATHFEIDHDRLRARIEWTEISDQSTDPTQNISSVIRLLGEIAAVLSPRGPFR